MITLYASVHLLLGVGYIAVLGLWTSYDIWKEYKASGHVERFGFGLVAMGFTCGPHHIEHGLHILVDGLLNGIDLAFAVVALPWPFAFMVLRLIAAFGGKGDILSSTKNAQRRNYTFLAFWLILSFWTGAGWVALLLQYGWPGAMAGPQYVLAALFSVVGWLFFRSDNLNSVRYRSSSTNSLLLAGLFVTCGASHLITGTLIGTGLFSFAHLYYIDSLGVLAVIIFLLLVYERTWNLDEGFTTKR